MNMAVDHQVDPRNFSKAQFAGVVVWEVEIMVRQPDNHLGPLSIYPKRERGPIWACPNQNLLAIHKDYIHRSGLGQETDNPGGLEDGQGDIPGEAGFVFVVIAHQDPGMLGAEQFHDIHQEMVGVVAGLMKQVAQDNGQIVLPACQIQAKG
jgi:hypothetical protein